MWEDVQELLCKLDKEDDEIEKSLPWFYETVKCFKQVKQEPVKQLIRRSEYAPVRKDHVIIRQGEVGDCCYIILRGNVSVYARRTEDTEHLIFDEPSTRTTVVKTHKDRAKFGAEVSVLRAGDKFGDLCFYKSNGERNATVIADDNLDLLVIDTHLYQRYLADRFVDMKDQLRFMETSPLFKGFPYDYRITLLEKMRTRRMNYGCGLVRQGDPVTSIFIVCRGEALLKVNPTKLSQQYELHKVSGGPEPRPLTVIQRRREILRNGYPAGENLLKQQNITIATVGANEIVGDVEFMLNLATHHVTATCNSAMLVMEMEVTELQRLILKRDIGITDYIHSSVVSKLNGRATRCARIPQYRALCDMALNFVKLKQTNAQGNNRGEGSRRSTLLKVSNLVKLTARMGGFTKAKPMAAPEERSGSIVSALKKTATVAVEIGGGNRMANKLLEAAAAKKLAEGVETSGQDEVTATRISKGKSRKEGQAQEKGKKQYTVKEYKALKKKMQVAGKTIRPSD